MARRAKSAPAFDRELADLPPDLRWRTWMSRVEAVIFAAPHPVSREVLSRLVGDACRLDELLADIRDELRHRPYDLVQLAGGWHHRTRKPFGDAIQASGLVPAARPGLSRHEEMVLMAIAYWQPITRTDLGRLLGREVSRDAVAALRADGYVTSGPRSPQPGAPYTYVTTSAFLTAFGFDSLRDLPDIEALEDAGLLAKDAVLDGAVPEAGSPEDEADIDEPDMPDEPLWDDTAVGGPSASATS